MIYQIKIPNNTNISWNSDFIKVEGPFGILIKKKEDFLLKKENNKLKILFSHSTELNNFYYTTIRQLIDGVSKGFSYKLRLNGVGFKVLLEGNVLKFKIGFSHEAVYIIPQDVQIEISKMKGTLLLIKGKELYRVKQVAAEIRSLKKPDAYKGKGIQYYDEILTLKKGKKESK